MIQNTLTHYGFKLMCTAETESSIDNCMYCYVACANGMTEDNLLVINLHLWHCMQHSVLTLDPAKSDIDQNYKLQSIVVNGKEVFDTYPKTLTAIEHMIRSWFEYLCISWTEPALNTH